MYQKGNQYNLLSLAYLIVCYCLKANQSKSLWIFVWVSSNHGIITLFTDAQSVPCGVLQHAFIHFGGQFVFVSNSRIFVSSCIGLVGGAAVAIFLFQLAHWWSVWYTGGATINASCRLFWWSWYFSHFLVVFVFMMKVLQWKSSMWLPATSPFANVWVILSEGSILEYLQLSVHSAQFRLQVRLSINSLCTVGHHLRHRFVYSPGCLQDPCLIN